MAAVLKKLFILLVIFCAFIYFYYTTAVKHLFQEEQKDIYEKAVFYSKHQKYLINTSTCKIPDVDPFNEEIRNFFHKEKYTKCTNSDLLTYIDKSDGLAKLKIDSSVRLQYSYLRIHCCYSNVYRFNYHNKTDTEVRYSPCIKFNANAIISYPFIKVECFNFFRHIYSNVHATVIPTEKQVASKFGRTNRFSVLVVGIDSMSKLNLKRTMPKTYDYLEQHFHNLKGYNKIGDNTFPNLMAILTGQNTFQLFKSCNSTVKLNKCDMIWSKFQELGYVTAYAEDDLRISTFNYNRPGFEDPPTDYYYTPYFVAAQELGRTLRYGLNYCTGPETSAERVFNAVQDFSVSFKNVPAFGLFWVNSFSHNDINLPTAMDDKVLKLLSDTSFKSSLDDTIIVFLSDHGFRFGDIRHTHTGWLEERLPFIYIYIPDSFKNNFKQKYRNFVVNTQRLTTPYDIYCTFQEILEIGNNSYKAKQSRGCPNCQSLFKTVSENRTCKEAAIDQHWCTCTEYNYVSTKNDLVKQVALYVVKKINNFVKNFTEGHHCSTYDLKNILKAGRYEHTLSGNNQTVQYILIITETSPNATFEATVEAHTTSRQGNFKLLGDVSRINRYKDHSYCVEDAILKKYCFCNR